jgi:transposase
VEQFYRALPRPVTIGVESDGYAQWFHALIQREGHTLLVGDATKIRAMVPRKTKTDRCDAAHLLQLLVEDRFPLIWVPDPGVRDLRALVAHRMRLVRMRTMVKNGLHAIALNSRLAAGRALFTRRGRAQLQALALPPPLTQRSDESLELLTWLDAHIDPLGGQIAAAVAADEPARRLMTNPGVGPLTALATVVVLGPVTRFPTSKHVVSSIGRAPTVDASADKGRLGHITEQGNALLRYVLRQAGQVAARSETDLRRLYSRVMHRHGRGAGLDKRIGDAGPPRYIAIAVVRCSSAFGRSPVWRYGLPRPR